MLAQRWGRWARVIAGIGACGWLAVGCGDDGAGDNGDDGTDPRGTVIAGLGPVDSAEEARQRILTQYLGLADAGDGRLYTGTGQQPRARVYRLGDGLWPAGTSVDGYWTPRLMLPRPSYLFWYDPDPLALLGHRCRLLYLESQDGRIIEQKVLSDPKIDDQRPLRYDEPRQEQKIYEHRLWGPGIITIRRSAAARAGRALAFGAAGLSIVGNDQPVLQGDAAYAQAFFEALGGDPAKWKQHADTEETPAGKDGLAAALESAAEGLGPNDKFFLHIAAHGGPDGTFQIGKDLVSWTELRDLLRAKVHAGHINIVIGSCFGGTAIAVFEAWTGPSDIQVVTATDATHPARGTPDGETDPEDTGIYGDRCWLTKIFELLQQKLQEGPLDVGDVEQAFQDAELTKAEIDEKVRDVRDGYGGSLRDEYDTWYEDYLVDGGEDDEVRPNGEPQKTHVRRTIPEPVQRLEHSIETGTGAVISPSGTASLTGLSGAIRYFHDGRDRRISVSLQAPQAGTSIALEADLIVFGTVGVDQPVRLAGPPDSPVQIGPVNGLPLISVASQSGRLVLLNPGVPPDQLGSPAPVGGLLFNPIVGQRPPDVDIFSFSGDLGTEVWIDLNERDEQLGGGAGSVTSGGITTPLRGLLLSRFDAGAWIMQLLAFPDDGTRIFAVVRSDLVVTAPAAGGDANADGDVDLGDFEAFQQCFTGSGVPASPAGQGADFDHDSDVDLADFSAFQQQLSGP